MQKPEIRQLYGVGGWLALFVVVLVAGALLFLASIHFMLNHAQEANPAIVSHPKWAMFKVGMWTVALAFAALNFFAVYKLQSEYKLSSVRIAIWVLWLTGLGAPLLIMLLSLWLGFEVDQAVAGFVEGVLQTLIGTVLWTLYLLKSTRVRNTYK